MIDVNTIRGLRPDAQTAGPHRPANEPKGKSSGFFEFMMSTFPADKSSGIPAPAGLKHKSATRPAEGMDQNPAAEEFAESDGKKRSARHVQAQDHMAAIYPFGSMFADPQTVLQIHVDGGSLPDGMISPEVNTGIPATMQADPFASSGRIWPGPDGSLDVPAVTVSAARLNTLAEQAIGSNGIDQGVANGFTDAVFNSGSQLSDAWEIHDPDIRGESGGLQSGSVSSEWHGMSDAMSDIAGENTLVTGSLTSVNGNRIKPGGLDGGAGARQPGLPAEEVETRQPLEAATLYRFEQSRLSHLRDRREPAAELQDSKPQEAESRVNAAGTDEDTGYRAIFGIGPAATADTGEISTYGLELRENEEPAGATAEGARDLYDQVTAGVESGIRSNAGNSFTVQLKPEGLGKITVEMVEKEGHIRLRLTADTRETEKLLSAKVDLLRESLRHLNAEVIEVTDTDAGKIGNSAFMGGQPDLFQASSQQLQWSFEGRNGGSDQEVLRGASKAASETYNEPAVYLKDIAGQLNIYA